MKSRTTASVRSPDFIEPMKALSVQTLLTGRWLCEVKFDGYRALAFKIGKEVRLISRNQKEFTKFSHLNDALKSFSPQNAVIDGEIAALDPEGRSSFQLLQAYEIGEERPPLVYYVFDLLFLLAENYKGNAKYRAGRSGDNPSREK